MLSKLLKKYYEDVSKLGSSAAGMMGLRLDVTQRLFSPTDDEFVLKIQSLVKVIESFSSKLKNEINKSFDELKAKYKISYAPFPKDGEWSADHLVSGVRLVSQEEFDDGLKLIDALKMARTSYFAYGANILSRALFDEYAKHYEINEDANDFRKLLEVGADELSENTNLAYRFKHNVKEIVERSPSASKYEFLLHLEDAIYAEPNYLMDSIIFLGSGYVPKSTDDAVSSETQDQLSLRLFNIMVNEQRAESESFTPHTVRTEGVLPPLVHGLKVVTRIVPYRAVTSLRADTESVLPDFRHDKENINDMTSTSTEGPEDVAVSAKVASTNVLGAPIKISSPRDYVLVEMKEDARIPSDSLININCKKAVHSILKLFCEKEGFDLDNIKFSEVGEGLKFDFGIFNSFVIGNLRARELGSIDYKQALFSLISQNIDSECEELSLAAIFQSFTYQQQSDIKTILSDVWDHSDFAEEDIGIIGDFVASI